MDECKFGNGITIKPDGENELDACIFEDIQCYKNVTVYISKCMHCGKIEISWEKQDDTYEVLI